MRWRFLITFNSPSLPPSLPPSIHTRTPHPSPFTPFPPSPSPSLPPSLPVPAVGIMRDTLWVYLTAAHVLHGNRQPLSIFDLHVSQDLQVHLLQLTMSGPHYLPTAVHTDSRSFSAQLEGGREGGRERERREEGCEFKFESCARADFKLKSLCRWTDNFKFKSCYA